MVDIGSKEVTRREAEAESRVRFPFSLREYIDGSELVTKKGRVFSTASVAGTMAAKRTYDLLPLCHIIPTDRVSVTTDILDDRNVRVRCSVSAHHKTGVEMEALTGASVAALTIYDMCKFLGHGIVIEETRLLHKSGGKSDYRSGRGPDRG